MRHVIPAALALSLVAGGVAVAQTSTTTTNPPTPATTNMNTTGTAAPATTTGTRNGALGTNAVGTPTTSTNTAVTTSSAQNPRAPVAGANSFTEGEARRRIQDKGFGQVTDLKLDNQGIWRGTATKDGKSTAVALDYQGNVVGQ